MRKKRKKKKKQNHGVYGSPALRGQRVIPQECASFVDRANYTRVIGPRCRHESFRGDNLIDLRFVRRNDHRDDYFFFWYVFYFSHGCPLCSREQGDCRRCSVMCGSCMFCGKFSFRMEVLLFAPLFLTFVSSEKKYAKEQSSRTRNRIGHNFVYFPVNRSNDSSHYCFFLIVYAYRLHFKLHRSKYDSP